MTFGEKVRELRIRNGYSQERLAEMTGVTKRTVRNWETEGKYPGNIPAARHFMQGSPLLSAAMKSTSEVNRSSS